MSQQSVRIPDKSAPPNQGSHFDELAQGSRAGFFSEFYGFLRDNKKWWLGPMLVVLLLLGAVLLASGTAIAPFIYTLF